MKTRCRPLDLFIDAGELITQPNQAFTPREILEQFARNEVVSSVYEPSDSLTDDNVPDSEMDNIIEFEDKIDAEGHLVENQYQLYKEQKQEEEKDKEHETDQSKPSPSKGPSQSSDKIAD